MTARRRSSARSASPRPSSRKIASVCWPAAGTGPITGSTPSRLAGGISASTVPPGTATGVVVNHRARKFGRSKYGVARFIKGLLDLLTVRFLTRFAQRPLHLLGGIGLALLLLGGLGLVDLAVVWLRDQPGDRPIGNRPLLVYSAALLVVGTQLLSLGVLAELVTSYNIHADDTYSIAETLDSPAPAEESPRDGP